MLSGQAFIDQQLQEIHQHEHDWRSIRKHHSSSSSHSRPHSRSHSRSNSQSQPQTHSSHTEETKDKPRSNLGLAASDLHELKLAMQEQLQQHEAETKAAEPVDRLHLLKLPLTGFPAHNVQSTRLLDGFPSFTCILDVSAAVEASVCTIHVLFFKLSLLQVARVILSPNGVYLPEPTLDHEHERARDRQQAASDSPMFVSELDKLIVRRAMFEQALCVFCCCLFPSVVSTLQG